MSGESRTVERFKTDLLGELHLMTPADLRAYWKQVKWPKPNLVELAKGKSSRLAKALNLLPPETLAQASAQLDPFGCLLNAMDVAGWSEYCQKHRWPWMTRIWLAAASQLRAERRSIHKAHGRGDTREEFLRHADTPDMPQYADEYFVAQLRHAKEKRRDKLLATPGLDERRAKARQDGDEAWQRRFRRAALGAGKRAGVALAEEFIVQFWLEMLPGSPGLCFFSDPALDSLLDEFRLSTGNDGATKQLRVRLGLIQAGTRRHLIEKVEVSANRLLFVSFDRNRKRTIARLSDITWNGKQLWPRSA